MTYITGDTHGYFQRYYEFTARMKPTTDDVMIILGDAALNYHGGERDASRKYFVNSFPFTTFCIHGNHEMRPTSVPTYKEKLYRGGTVWYEEEYPNILFAKDGEIYDFDGRKCIVIGGAYSVDKFYRLTMGWHWFLDEQPSPEIKRRVEEQLASVRYKVDAVLSHTCPESTESWLGEIESNLTYEKWYCGHYHIAKKIDKLQFMFEDYDTL